MDNEVKVAVEFNPLRSRRIQIFMAFVFGVAITSGILLAYANFKPKTSELGIMTGPAQSKDLTEDQIKNIIDKVGKIAVLPKNETPVVGSVKDALALKGEKFFENAQNGDVVLMYKAAQKAFLYNRRVKKIVNIGPFGEPKREEFIDQTATISAQDNEASSSVDLKEVDNQ